MPLEILAPSRYKPFLNDTPYGSHLTPKSLVTYLYILNIWLEQFSGLYWSCIQNPIHS